jgi:hypothetical protein
MLYDPDTKNFLIFLKKVLQNTKTYDIISKSRETRVLTGQKKESCYCGSVGRASHW